MQADRHCEQLVRDADKDRFLASLFAPANRRPALYALYAFDIEVARVRDLARQPMPGAIRLQWWRDVLDGERAGEASAHPVATALLAALAGGNVPPHSLLDLLEAREFDLYDDPMPTAAALTAYARRTVGSIVAVAADLLAPGAVDRRAADTAGAVLGVTHVLQTIAAHASRGQVYLPAEVLDRHGVAVGDILAGRASPQLTAVLADLCLTVRSGLVDLAASWPRLGATLPAFLPTATVPLTLARVQAPGYDPFRTPSAVSQWRRQWALWRASRGRLTY